MARGWHEMTPDPEMNRRRRRQMQDIRSMSEQMLRLARDHAWDSLAELEPRRRSLIMQFFETPVSEEDAAEIAATIQDVLDIDREIIERGRKGREGIQQELARIRQGKRVVHAYHQAG